MPTFMDTSAFYAYLDSAARESASARATFDELLESEEPVVTHNYVVLESTALIHRRLGPKASRALLQELVPATTVVWVDESTHHAATSAYLATIKRRSSLVDLVSFEVMRANGIRRAFAFDDDFAEQGFETLP